MAMVFFLAPNGRWSARNLVGDAAIDGKVKTYAAGTTTPKLTWSDPQGSNENETTIELDAAGEANIYWGYDPDAAELYYIEVYDKDDNLVYTQDDYPSTYATGGNNFIEPSIFNYVRNPQFTFWSNSVNYPTISSSQTIYDYVADEWTFERNNTTAIVNVSRESFTAGQSAVPANPPYYLHYECGNAVSASETYKRFKQVYQSVQTLSGQQISFAIWAKSPTSSPMSINIAQFFGTGGAPSDTVTTNVLTVTLTTSWKRYTGITTIPAAIGTLGTNGDDYTALQVDLPLNTAGSSLDMTNGQLQVSTRITQFIIESQEQNFLTMQNLISQSLFKTSNFKLCLTNDPQPGWVACDDGTLGNFASGATHAFLSTQALFTVIWNKIANTYAPIFNSDGTIGTRGADAPTDYNANKRLSLTKTLGRILATAGTATLSTTFTTYGSQTFTRSGDTLVMASTADLLTETPIVFTTTNTLPAPLAPATTYYAINVNATTIQVATTLANALAGTFITLTTAGTGVHTIFNAGQLIIADSTSFYTGTPVTLTTTTTLPAPLALATTYYVINTVNTNKIHIELATTYANALAGIPIVISSAGTGTHTVAITYADNWLPGQTAGEYTHAPIVAELAAHTHTVQLSGNSTDSGGGSPGVIETESDDLTHPVTITPLFTTSSAGGELAHNNIQPTTFIYTFLKL